MKQAFINKIAAAAVAACKGTGIFPSVTIAQAILETGWGKHSVGNNLYGIKARGEKTPYWNGEFIEAITTEYFGGKKQTIRAKFRKYSSIEMSIRDHNRLLMTPRYKPARDAANAFEQCDKIKSCGYATDPLYANKLKNLIRTENLLKYDGESC